MVSVSVPGNLIVFDLVTPLIPTLALSTSKQFKIRPRAACFDDPVKLIGFA
jgi:hypothetical protein